MKRKRLLNIIEHYGQGAGKLARALLLSATPQSAQRKQVCMKCPLRHGAFCSMCGCIISQKVKLPEEHCPIGKW